MEEFLSVQDATNKVFTELEEFTGWKLLKSQRRLKKKIGSLELYIDFFTSKWNTSYRYVGLNAEFSMAYKKLGKLPFKHIVAYCAYHPLTGDDLYWYDISTTDKLEAVIDELKQRIQNTALTLEKQIENDLENAVQSMLDDHFEEYRVRLEFAADILGTDAIKPQVQTVIESLTDVQRQQVLDYKNGARTIPWMNNPNNLKYIVDNNWI